MQFVSNDARLVILGTELSWLPYRVAGEAVEFIAPAYASHRWPSEGRLRGDSLFLRWTEPSGASFRMTLVSVPYER